MSIIALITDFGRQDWYVASMKGVILSLDPHAVIVDITHEITPGDVRSGGFVLDQCYRDYPEGTVFVTVVDPGVGTERRNLAIKTKNHYFIGPDNGLFSFLEWNEGRKNLRIHQISSDLPGMGRKISSTFHGRDIFAPAAALLSSGSPSPFAKMGPPLDSMELLKKPEALYTPDRAEGEVVYIDHFGNAITSLEGNPLEKSGLGQNLQIVCANLRIPFVKTFGQVARGEPLAYIGSGGRLEIAVNGGSAAQALKIRIGCKIRVALRE